VSSAGTATGSIVSGGTEIVSSGGTDLGAHLSGGSQVILGGGTAAGPLSSPAPKPCRAPR
jgi:antigen 43